MAGQIIVAYVITSGAVLVFAAFYRGMAWLDKILS